MVISTGKGDLVGCDINAHLQLHNSNNGQMGGGDGGGRSNNPSDVIVKSSSDVKVKKNLIYINLIV